MPNRAVSSARRVRDLIMGQSEVERQTSFSGFSVDGSHGLAELPD